MKERFKLRAIVYLVLIQEGKVLLLRRFNTGFFDGLYSLPAGHLEEHETLVQGVIRESREEIGIEVDPENLKLVHIIHAKDNFDERILFFFEIEAWTNEPEIMEPDKCDDLSWHDIQNLPENVIPYIKQAIENFSRGVLYSEHGW